MTRFWGNHPGTRQVRGSRKVKPATKEERLESMHRELATRERVYGTDHWMTVMQREFIAAQMTKAEFVARNADLVVKERGRWGIYHYALKTRRGDYQKVGQITSDSPEGVLEKLYDRLLLQVKPPAVEEVNHASITK